MKPFRPHRHGALLLLTLLSSPAFAQSYSENMHIGEYIVGLAALALVAWDIGRRFLGGGGTARRDAPAFVAAAVSEAGRKSCDLGVRWARLRELALSQPLEFSLLLSIFTLLSFARVPFSLSAWLVGALTYLSLVLGARLAANSGVAPAKAASRAISTVQLAAHAEPSRHQAREQIEVAVAPVPPEPTGETARPVATAPAAAAAEPAEVAEPVAATPAEATPEIPALPEAAEPIIATRSESTPAAAPEVAAPAAAKPASRRRASGNGAAKPTRSRATKPKTS